jgi:hypothetical protein
MDDTAFAHERQDPAGATPRPARPAVQAAARVHQRLHVAGDETVVDEDVLVDVELLVSPLQIAGAIASDAVAQRQILRARGSPDRIGLHESEDLERPLERRRSEETPRDGVTSNSIEAVFFARHIRRPRSRRRQYTPPCR